jgi:hypothetical protein
MDRGGKTFETGGNWLVVFCFLFPIAMLALSGCSDLHLCRNTEVARVGAPDRLHLAIVFQRDCGATTGFTTQVSVLHMDEQLSGSGNAFIADGNHGAAPSGHWGGPWAEIRWIDKDHLLVRYAARSRVFEQSSQVAGIRISYEPVNQ